MRAISILAATALALAAQPLAAALPVGTHAPDFRTMGALAGKPFRLHLAEQLKHGPVVLYFFPKAFTQGCTLETRAFSEAMPEFRKLGARVIGMSADDYATLARFSKEECRDAFPVATAGPATVKAYDVLLKPDAQLTNRTSYVIAPDGTILHAHSEMDWRNHVSSTLAAVKAWKAKKRKG